MAIKPVAKEFVEYVPTLIEFGLLKPNMSHSGKAVENAMKEFNTLRRQPFYGAALEKYGSVANPTKSNLLNVTRPTIMPSDIADPNRAMINYRSDRSGYGSILDYLATPTNVDVQSGTAFTPLHEHMNAGWMSVGKAAEGKVGTAQKAHKQAQRAAEMGFEPVANSIIMGETSSRFSTPPAEVMYARIKDLNMPKESLDALDAEIRKTKKDWVGIRSEGALDQLMGRNGFSFQGAGAERKRFLQVLEKPEFRKMGFPQPNTVLPLMDNPEYANVDYGMSGVNMWLPDADKETYQALGLHNSYSDVMPMKGILGQFPAPVSWAANNPRAARELAKAKTSPKISKKTGELTPARPYTEMEKVNANMDRVFGNRGTVQLLDQEWNDSVSSAIEHNAKLIAKYGSMGAAIAAGEVMADTGNPVDDLRTSERQFGMSPQERAIDDLRASEREFVPESNPEWKPARFEGMATTLGRLKGDKNYQNFENIAPFGTGLVDYANNIATGSQQGLLDYIFAGGDLAVLPAPLKKAATGILGMFK